MKQYNKPYHTGITTAESRKVSMHKKHLRKLLVPPPTLSYKSPYDANLDIILVSYLTSISRIRTAKINPFKC